MRDPSAPSGPPRGAARIRQELEQRPDEVLQCYEKGLSVRETMLFLHAMFGIPAGGLPDPRDEPLYLNLLRDVLVRAARAHHKGMELQSFFNLFDPARNSRSYRLSLFDSVFRDKLEHILTWQPPHYRDALEELIGRPLRERSDYPVAPSRATFP